MNEKGLVANLLYLAESDYATSRRRAGRRSCISLVGQYALDNFATVAEAVADSRRRRPSASSRRSRRTGPKATSTCRSPTPTGDSAIFQYLDGKLVIHHGKDSW